MALNYSIKEIENKKIVDGGFLIYDSLFFSVLGITEKHKTLESVYDFTKLINSADFTQIDSSITDSDLFLKELNSSTSTSYRSNLRKIDFYFNFILDALHYNYKVYLINASTESNVFEILNRYDLDFLVYDPIKTTISTDFKTEIKLKNIPVLLNSSISSSSFKPIENFYILNNVTDLNYQFDNFYARSELNDTDFNQLSFTVAGAKRIKRYYGDENITDDSEYSNSPYVLVSLLSDISGMLARSYSEYPWISIAGFRNGRVLNQRFSKIALSSVRYSEDIIPQTPTNITLSSGSKLNTAHSRGINTVLNLPSPTGKEYYLGSDLSGITSSENEVKKTFSYGNLFSYIARNSKQVINEYLFEPNTPENRERITSKLNRMMETVKINNGVEYYTVTCNDSNNTTTTIAQSKLIVDLSYKPIQSPSIVNLNFTT